MKVSVILIGFSGRVGRKFLHLLKERREYLLNKYGLEVVVMTAINSTGVYYNKDGLEIERIISDPFPVEHKLDLTCREAILEHNAQVLINAAPTNIQNGQPGLSLIRTAIKRGMHIITLDKGPLVLAYEDLKHLAAVHNVQLKVSGATGAALPTADIGIYSLAGAEIEKISGILNGTCNYILNRMHDEKDLTYVDALKEAQEKGIAEADPGLDVEGWDTAIKILILTYILMDGKLSLDDIKLEGINFITPNDIKDVLKEGKILKLVGEARKIGNEIHASVSLQKIPQNHALAGTSGPEKAVLFSTDLMGEILILGGKSSPVAAAAAALKDLINLTRLLYSEPVVTVVTVLTAKDRLLGHKRDCRVYSRFLLQNFF